MCKGILLLAAGAASKPAKHHPAPAAAGISGHIWPLDIATPTAIDKLRDTEVGFVCQPIEKISIEEDVAASLRGEVKREPGLV